MLCFVTIAGMSSQKGNIISTMTEIIVARNVLQIQRGLTMLQANAPVVATTSRKLASMLLRVVPVVKSFLVMGIVQKITPVIIAEKPKKRRGKDD